MVKEKKDRPQNPNDCKCVRNKGYLKLKLTVLHRSEFLML